MKKFLRSAFAMLIVLSLSTPAFAAADGLQASSVAGLTAAGESAASLPVRLILGALGLSSAWNTAAEPSAPAEKDRVEYGQAGVRLFGEQVVEPGGLYTLPDGQRVPSTICYTGAEGEGVIYLPVQQISELLGIETAWNAAANSVDIAAPSRGEVVITSGLGSASDPDKDVPKAPQKPRYGQRIGAFEEVDPLTYSPLEDTIDLPVSYMKDTRIQYQDFGFSNYTVQISPLRGRYLMYTVTNNGNKNQTSQVIQKNLFSPGSWKSFTSVLVKPGETVVRAFRVDPDARPFEYSLTFGVGGSLDLYYGTDVTVSLEQFP